MIIPSSVTATAAPLLVLLAGKMSTASTCTEEDIDHCRTDYKDTSCIPKLYGEQQFTHLCERKSRDKALYCCCHLPKKTLCCSYEQTYNVFRCTESTDAVPASNNPNPGFVAPQSSGGRVDANPLVPMVAADTYRFTALTSVAVLAPLVAGVVLLLICLVAAFTICRIRRRRRLRQCHVNKEPLPQTRRDAEQPMLVHSPDDSASPLPSAPPPEDAAMADILGYPSQPAPGYYEEPDDVTGSPPVRMTSSTAPGYYDDSCDVTGNAPVRMTSYYEDSGDVTGNAPVRMTSTSSELSGPLTPDSQVTCHPSWAPRDAHGRPLAPRDLIGNPPPAYEESHNDRICPL